MVTRDVLAIECDGSMVALDNLDPRENYPKPEPVETTIEVPIRGERYFTRISSLLNTEQNERMGHFLKENSNVFAWSVVEMPSISLFVICYPLNINLMIKPIK